MLSLKEGSKLLLSLSTYAAVGVACFLYGSGVTETKWQKKFTDAAAQSQQAANQQAIESAKSSAEVDSKQAASTQSINTISEEVSQRLQQQEPKVIYRTKVVNQCSKDDSDISSTRPQTGQSDDAVAPWRFDVGTVRLLNAARLGLSAQSANLGNDQGDTAPSTVGIGEFASNDLQIVARYHALKIKHDALVDWVNSLKAKNIGLCVASEPLYPTDLDDP